MSWAVAEESHHGQEQGDRVQAAGGQDLVIQQQVWQVIVHRGDPVTHGEGLAPCVWGSRVSGGFRCPGSSVTLPSLPASQLLEIRMMHFQRRSFVPSFTMCTRAASHSSFPRSPRGAAWVSQDGIGLIQSEAFVLELGELPVQTGGLGGGLQPGLLSHHLLLLALALLSQPHTEGIAMPWTGK